MNGKDHIVVKLCSLSQQVLLSLKQFNFLVKKIKEMFWKQVRFLRAKRQSRLEVFERLSLFRKILINYSQCLSIQFLVQKFPLWYVKNVIGEYNSPLSVSSAACLSASTAATFTFDELKRAKK